MLQLIGRRSSLFTRLPLLFAEHLQVPYEFVPIHDMTQLAPEVYAGNPALKLPILRFDDEVVFGAQNICRVFAENAATAGSAARIVWPEALRDPLSRNAQELVWHGMATQVQLVMGTVLGKLPVDNMYFAKARTSLEASLVWLDAHVETALGLLPPRDLSVFEVSLYCLHEHLLFRPTLPVTPYAQLAAFADRFGELPAARRTAYRFDDTGTR